MANEFNDLESDFNALLKVNNTNPIPKTYEDFTGENDRGEIVLAVRCLRNSPFNGSYPDDLLEAVFARGARKTEEGRIETHCYLCDRILKRDLRKCQCSPGKGQKLNCSCAAWEVEHVVAKHFDPIRFDVEANFLPACVRCNSPVQKGAKSLLEAMQKNGLNDTGHSRKLKVENKNFNSISILGLNVCTWALEVGKNIGMLTETVKEIDAALAHKHQKRSFAFFLNVQFLD